MPIIDGKKYTYEQAHRMLWNWLADNSGKSKGDFFLFHDYDKRPINNCYACQSVHFDEDFDPLS